ncbi:histone deacetylase HDT1-like protein [Corchorus capsularis]|uniref:Histone deacetylase HDT1-like protein n=1 Tax=Corchorus capsularis TaxID=210143 RepID=A0A1R3IHJ3_COCAP|nr:histone deacetylase HDT1-like protein [Corchorus capsularis]
MEFWGAEVKSGQNFVVELDRGSGKIVHLSQVALGEVTGDNKKEKGNEVCVYIKVKDSKFVIGTLSHEKFPHIPLDLVLDDKFQLSHNWKNGSVHFTGYYAEINEETCDPADKEPAVQATESGPTTSKQVKIVEPNKDEDSSSSSDEEDSSSDSDDEESSDDEQAGMLVNGENESDDDDESDSSDEDSSDEDSSDEDEQTPKKAETSKKRPAESATKTPVPEKKAKLVTPQKTDGKKVGGHTATPHPSKKAGKAEAGSGQAKQNQKSGGSSSSFACKSCGRSFGSDNALQSHSKAKHGAAA